MSEDGSVSSGGLSATLEVQFVERDGKVFLIFGAGVGAKVIEVGVSEIDPEPYVITIVT